MVPGTDTQLRPFFFFFCLCGGKCSVVSHSTIYAVLLFPLVCLAQDSADEFRKVFVYAPPSAGPAVAAMLQVRYKLLAAAVVQYLGLVCVRACVDIPIIIMLGVSSMLERVSTYRVTDYHSYHCLSHSNSPAHVLPLNRASS